MNIIRYPHEAREAAGDALDAIAEPISDIDYERDTALGWGPAILMSVICWLGLGLLAMAVVAWGDAIIGV